VVTNPDRLRPELLDRAVLRIALEQVDVPRMDDVRTHPDVDDPSAHCFPLRMRATLRVRVRAWVTTLVVGTSGGPDRRRT